MLFQTSHYNSNLGTAGHRIPSMASSATAASRAAPSGIPANSAVHPPYFPSTNYQASQFYPHEAQRQQQQPIAVLPVKEEAPAVNGGISSVLDYELPTMSAFLSWCSFGMLKQTRNPTKEFESLLVSVLFATRLPKSTIIIALEYLNQRYCPKHLDLLNELEIFLKLVIALILANKFNDDNTFTNKSWYGATGLAVEILNLEERLWLEEVEWQLNVVNFESNIMTLEECWATWLSKVTQQQSSRLTSSSPVSANSLSPKIPSYSHSPVSSPLYSPSVDLTYHNQNFVVPNYQQQSQHPMYQQPQQAYIPPLFYNGVAVPQVPPPMQNVLQDQYQPPQHTKTWTKLRLSQSYLPSVQSSPICDSDGGKHYHSASSPFLMSSPVSMYDNAPTWSASSTQFSKSIWASTTGVPVPPVLPYGSSAIMGNAGAMFTMMAGQQPQPLPQQQPSHFQHHLESQGTYVMAPLPATVNGYPHNFVGYTNPFYYNVASTC